jgi:sulfatase modifying factor 1
MRIFFSSIICFSIMACQRPGQQEPTSPREEHDTPRSALNAHPTSKTSGSVKVESNFTLSEQQPCPSGMVHIDGQYCPKVKEHCEHWLDDSNRPGARCAHYAPSTCLAAKVHMSYCIDREELHDDSGMPYGDLSWAAAKQKCEDRGARLCQEDEWNFAAEGEDIHPYPYGDGYTFSNKTCNIERQPLVCGSKACDHRASITDFPACTSNQFQIHDLTGNVDEWIEVPRYTVPSGLSMRSGLKGGHAAGGRHRVRVITKGHDEHFRDPPFEGSRCCKGIDQ